MSFTHEAVTVLDTEDCASLPTQQPAMPPLDGTAELPVYVSPEDLGVAGGVRIQVKLIDDTPWMGMIPLLELQIKTYALGESLRNTSNTRDVMEETHFSRKAPLILASLALNWAERTGEPAVNFLYPNDDALHREAVRYLPNDCVRMSDNPDVGLGIIVVG